MMVVKLTEPIYDGKSISDTAYIVKRSTSSVKLRDGYMHGIIIEKHIMG
jgi:hypothetical protein